MNKKDPFKNNFKLKNLILSAIAVIAVIALIINVDIKSVHRYESSGKNAESQYSVENVEGTINNYEGTYENNKNKPVTGENTGNYVTCTMEINCIELSDFICGRTSKEISTEMYKVDADIIKYVPEDGYILKKVSMKVPAGSSVYDALKIVTKAKKIQLDASEHTLYNSAYIRGIGYIYEFSGGPGSGWIYYVNNNIPNYGCSEYEIKENDNIQWYYVMDYSASYNDFLNQ